MWCAQPLFAHQISSDSLEILNHFNAQFDSKVSQEINTNFFGLNPFKLLPDDVLISASDGLQFLGDEDIQEVVTRNHEAGCDAIADALIRALIGLDDPDQDNIAFSVAKVCS